ncbi:MAG: hypothetical protein IKU37_07715 [Candidatus Gastranaerophilales bacterium]|nr:hypothetical protein [Candidatus Gastranaerophilales bacterium]
MQNQKKEVKSKEYKEIQIEQNEVTFSDYYSFNLQNLAQKIKMQTYRPKSKMLYL